MARTFTIFFQHQKSECLAVVCQVNEILCIYLPDEQFHDLLPNGRFIYDPKTGLNPDGESDSSAKSLMMEVIKEIQVQKKIPQEI